MAASRSIIDWEALGRTTNLEEAVRFLPPERVIEVLGLGCVVETVGADKMLDELLARIPAEQLQEMLRRKQEKR